MGNVYPSWHTILLVMSIFIRISQQNVDVADNLKDSQKCETVNDIAELLQVKAGTIKWRLHNSRERLKENIMKDKKKQLSDNRSERTTYKGARTLVN